MRIIRSMAAALLALFGTVVLAVAWTAATAVQLTATALIMGGTFHPLSTPLDDPVSYINPYLENAVDGLINPAEGTVPGTDAGAISPVEDSDAVYAVITPEEFFPLFGTRTFDKSVHDGLVNLQSCVRGTGCVVNREGQLDPQPPLGPPTAGEDFVIFGYSQSAVIASLLKRDLIENPREPGASTSFFLLSNPMRPNGGILARSPFEFTIPIIGVTFVGATPTNSCEAATCMPTVDVAPQYDPMGGDAPASLTNVLAIINAAAGYYYLHGESQFSSFDDALYQGSYGDTDYYLYPTKRLPILMPFSGFVPSPILTALNAPLQAAIEGAYRRDINPGVVTTVSLLPFHDPIRTIINILLAIPTGIDDALAEATGDPTFRPLGTAPVTSPYGVGGPELPAPPEENAAVALRAEPAGRDDATEEREDGGDGLDPAAEDDTDGPAEGVEKTREPEQPPTNEPERPAVRGPIQFDSQNPDPTTGQDGATETTSGEPEQDEDPVDESPEASETETSENEDGQAAA
jgi:hypothetical protein